MSSFDRQSDDWVDEQLRRVPVPPALLAALRWIAVSSDNELDEALREAPLPAGMLQRLKAIACDDASLDEVAAEVPLPTGLLQRLKTIPAEVPATWTESRIDWELRDVELPVDLSRSLKSIARETPHDWSDDRLDWEVREIAAPAELAAALSGIPYEVEEPGRPFHRRDRRPIHWLQLATALSLVFVITLSYASAIGGFLMSAFREEFAPEPVVLVEAPWRGELDVAVEPVEEASFAAVSQRVALPLDQLVASFAPEPLAAPLQQDGEGAFAESLRMFGGGSIAVAKPANVDPWLDLTLLNSRPITDIVPDALEPLHTVGERGPRGVQLPAVDAEALLFAARHGVHAFVSPRQHSELQSMSVPLGATTASYERVWEYLAQGSLPPPEQVHVEDFLQAVDYDLLPAAPGELALRTAAGVSPFDETNQLALLQVAVQAGELPIERPAASRRPTSLTIAVDTSGSMQRNQSLANARAALQAIVADLSPQDRISLVVFDEDAYVRVRDASASKRARLLSEFDQLTADRSTNVGEGLRLACSVARSSSLPGGGRRALVLITDGLGDLLPETLTAVERHLAAAAADGVELDIIDLGPETTSNNLLDRLTNFGQGRRRRAASREQITWALKETLTERTQTLARDASLTVRFHPDTVAGYRLVGHEAESIAGGNTAPLRVDLRAGQTSAALFELELRPTGGDEIAEAELSWLDAAGQSHTRYQRISRVQFATSFLEAKPALQKAAIVAEVAELLRGSYFATRRSTTIADVLDAVDQIPRSHAEDDSFVRFLRLIRAADRAGLR